MIIFIVYKTHPATGMAVGSDHVECRFEKLIKEMKIGEIKQYRNKRNNIKTYLTIRV